MKPETFINLEYFQLGFNHGIKQERDRIIERLLQAKGQNWHIGDLIKFITEEQK
jgi:hypothetical protein